jgi:hypothetical protein
MSEKPLKVSAQAPDKPKQFRLGHLGNLNQAVVALGKTIRAMADGSLDSQVGARICNGIGILRACLETATLEHLNRRLDEIEGPAPVRQPWQERRGSLQ